MEIINELLPYDVISGIWETGTKDSHTARKLTLKQIAAFEKIIESDDGWENLLKIFNKGRVTDAWLAHDWPDGFDELLLCVPLCSLVKFECSLCHVGIRQDNNSCANDFSLFGYIAELLKKNDREGLLNHVKEMIEIVSEENLKWNIAECKMEKIQTY